MQREYVPSDLLTQIKEFVSILSIKEIKYRFTLKAPLKKKRKNRRKINYRKKKRKKKEKIKKKVHTFLNPIKSKRI